MNKPRYYLDSYAWIEYFIGSEKGKRVAGLVENASSEVFVSTITLAEVTGASKRENRDAEATFNSMISLAKLFDITPEVAKEAGLFHAEIRRRIGDFGLADAFVVIAARLLGAKVVTGDPHFSKMKNVVFLS